MAWSWFSTFLSDLGMLDQRLFVRRDDRNMVAYNAPVLETVPLSELGGDLFGYPFHPRVVDASRLLPLLRQVYPPRVMERTNQRSKVVNGIVDAEVPSETNGSTRWVVRGDLPALRPRAGTEPGDATHRGVRVDSVARAARTRLRPPAAAESVRSTKSR